MAHLWTYNRTMRCVTALACALAFAILTTAPARSSSVVVSKGIMQKSAHAAAVQHLGSVSPSLPRQFTVILRTGSHTDAQTVASYFEHFGMLTIIAKNNRSIHVIGTYGSAGAASGTRLRAPEGRHGDLRAHDHEDTVPSRDRAAHRGHVDQPWHEDAGAQRSAAGACRRSAARLRPS